MTTLEQPAPFPHDDAATVEKAAKITNHHKALNALNMVQDMIGHPGNIQRAVTEWENAIRSMNGSYEGISRAHSQVQARWDGGAARGFNSYAIDVKATITSNITALQGALDATSQMYSAVIDAYKDGITFISKCAQSLLDFGGGLLSDWKVVAEVFLAGPTDGVSLALVLSHFTSLLSEFADNVTNLINAAIEANKGYTNALSVALKNINGIRPLPRPTDGLLDLHAWKPQ
ncbi:WXG100 family type VII secretion target [Actinomadura sp. NTSP31]|uniref:WXG100 family type VII secretion target n=1 Tax=Actinomadura sp. NTSP31 TaxID=1735447 RepID=UPI0035C19421